MQLFFFLLFSLSLGVHATPDLNQLIGKFSAVDSTCEYKKAEIRFEDHPELKNPLLVELKSEEGAISAQYFDVENLGKTITRESKEAQKIRNLFRKNILSREVKGCVDNWLFCGPWTPEMVVKLLDKNTISIAKSFDRPGCLYSKIK